MFSIGSLIVYSGTGVCRVEAVGPPPFDPGSKVEYYTLIPLQSTGTIYVPVDTKVFMRPILSREAAQELIRRIPEIQQAQLEHLDYRMLAQRYRSFLDSHSCEDLVQLIKTAYTKSTANTRSGKKPSKVDQDFQKRAEFLLHDELSAALDIPFDEVGDYITRQVEQMKQTGEIQESIYARTRSWTPRLWAMERLSSISAGSVPLSTTVNTTWGT